MSVEALAEVARGGLSLAAARGVPEEALAAARALGHVLVEAGRDAEAREVFEGLAALDPEDGYAQLALATLALRAGDPRAAEARLRALLAARPEDETARVRLQAIAPAQR